MNGQVRVLVYYRAPELHRDQIDEAYTAAARQLKDVPGLLGLELWTPLGDRGDGHFALGDRADGQFALAMYWRDLASLQSWERDLRERGHPSPLRVYQDRSRPGGHYQIYVATGT